MPVKPVTPLAAADWSLFGKLPSCGDFVRRNVAPSLAARLDDWLDVELGRQAAWDPDAWEAAFAATPSWRFHLAAGLLGSEEVAGVMAPSRDRVGRAFPVLAFAGVAADVEAAAERVERALTDAAPVDMLLRDLRALRPCEVGRPDPAPPGFGLWTSPEHPESPHLIAGLPAGAAFDLLFPPSCDGSIRATA